MDQNGETRRSSYSRGHVVGRFKILRSFFLLTLVGLMCLAFLASSTSNETSIFIDSRASTCFIDRDFANLDLILLVQKPFLLLVEVMDGRCLVFCFVIDETISLEMKFEGHNSYIFFNVIKPIWII